MSKQTADRLDRYAGLNQPRRAGMAQVMRMKAVAVESNPVSRLMVPGSIPAYNRCLM
jgi:hypothetical protein